MSTTGVNGPDLALDPRWQLVQRVCESRYFARSPKLREFLLFIAQRSLAGRSAEVTEVEIGHAVFGRGDDFVPTEDSIVRGSARQLRLKIKEYFDAEGATETWRIEIPKGGYIPVFTRNGEVPVAPPASQPRSWLALSLAANALLAALCLLLWLRDPSPVAGDPTVNVVSEMLKAAPGPIGLVATDFSLAGLRTLTPRPFDAFTVDDYARWDYSAFQPPPSSGEAALRAFDLFRTHRLTRSSDLTLTAMIVRLDSTGRRIVARHARDVTAREFRSGSHILLGNPYSTPWTALFEPSLKLKWLPGGYHDTSPARGAPVDYRGATPAYQETGSSYARVALVPNLADANQVLIIGGVNMVTMEAAGEFVLEPAHWAEIRQALGLSPGRPVPYFEALVETKAVENTPQSARLIFARQLPEARR
ncbi:MAG: hypothetical protein JST11_29625 [Acidobacteria bacterium]|nr:hypothetical protein [Acidobacteriota bacterium]